jgi:hypothetical protein
MVATTPAGRKLHGYELHSKARQGVGTLALIAILTLIGTFLDYSQLPPGVSSFTRNLVMSIDVGILAIFVGLAIWASKRPLPAAIIGLVLYVAIHGTLAVLNPSTIAKGILLKMAIVLALAKAIQAGSARARLERAG